jgi:hypothetical protein
VLRPGEGLPTASPAASELLLDPVSEIRGGRRCRYARKRVLKRHDHALQGISKEYSQNVEESGKCESGVKVG